MKIFVRVSGQLLQTPNKTRIFLEQLPASLYPIYKMDTTTTANNNNNNKDDIPTQPFQEDTSPVSIPDSPSELPESSPPSAAPAVPSPAERELETDPQERPPLEKGDPPDPDPVPETETEQPAGSTQEIDTQQNDAQPASEVPSGDKSIPGVPPSRETKTSLEPQPALATSDKVLESRGSRRSSDPPSAIGMTRVVTPGSEGAMPRLKERGRSRASGLPTPLRGTRTPKEDPLISLMDSVFLAADNNGDGTLEEKEFWRLLQSPLLNLKLTSADVKRLRARVRSGPSGSVNYLEFLPAAREMIRSAYQDRPRSSASNWTMLVSQEGGTVGYFNKHSGEIRDTPPEGIAFEDPNLIEDTIYDFLEVMDADQKGIISEKMFLESMDAMRSGALGLIITAEELEEIKQIFRLRKDRVPYEDIMPVLLELICRTYQVKDASYLNWIQLDSPRVGMFWFNKKTGRSKRAMPPEFQELHQWCVYQQQERSQEMTFVQQTIHDLEAANQEIQLGRVRVGQLENQVALLNEEMETVMVQLDETGTTLDQTTARLQQKTVRLEEASENLLKSEREKEQLRKKLQTGQPYSEDTGEGGASDLRRELRQTGDRLRQAERNLEGRDARLEEIETDVRIQLAKNRDLEEELLRVGELEGRLKGTESLLEKTDLQLEEKNAALSHARRSLQLAKQRNQELDEELQHMAELREKLHHSRCEINTLKSFLASKTAQVQSRDCEIERSKELIDTLQTRDEKRAQILSIVLERTARLQQEQKQSNTMGAKSLVGRPSSAGREHERTLSAPNTFPSPKPPAATVLGTGRKKNQQLAKRLVTESRNKSFAGVLPQLDAKPAQRRRSKPSFSLPNSNELRYLTRLSDASIKKDSELLNMPFYDDPPPPLLKTGDRVLVDVSKPGLSGLSPHAIAGHVKYMGKVDSAYIDSRYFVGVKLDEALGDCDGTRKGKRYFTCQPMHGLLLQSDRVVAVLDKKTLKYVPVSSRGHARNETS